MKTNYSLHINNQVFSVISKISNENQFSSFIIGGFVRDIILGRKSEDIDVVVLGDAFEVAKKCADVLGVNTVSYFKNFGTAHFKFNNLEVEFVSARKESYNKESRKPIVERGTLEDDQNRRDFTINALAISLNKSSFGEIVDPFKGLDDINNKIIKTPLNPEITYSDDPLRMMRAIRFASQLDFQIERKSLEAIRSNVERIEIISKERIISEVNKIILSDNSSKGFQLLFDTGLLDKIFPEMALLSGNETIDGKSHKDNFLHTLEVLENISKVSDNLWLRWAAIMHDIAKPPTKRFNKKVGWTFHGHEDLGAKMTPKIFRRLKLPLDNKMKYVQKLVRLHLRPISLVKGNVTDSAIRRLLNEAGDDIDDLMLLCNADITSKNEFKVQKYKRNFEKVREKLRVVEEKDNVRNFQPPISGKEVMEVFGLKPSNEVGIIKKSIKEAILDGKIENNYEQAFDFMIEFAKSLNLINIRLKD